MLASHTNPGAASDASPQIPQRGFNRHVIAAATPRPAIDRTVFRHVPPAARVSRSGRCANGTYLWRLLMTQKIARGRRFDADRLQRHGLRLAAVDKSAVAFVSGRSAWGERKHGDEGDDDPWVDVEGARCCTIDMTRKPRSDPVEMRLSFNEAYVGLEKIRYMEKDMHCDDCNAHRAPASRRLIATTAMRIDIPRPGAAWAFPTPTSSTGWSRWIRCTSRFPRELHFARHRRPWHDLSGGHLPCRFTSLRSYSGAAWHLTTQVQRRLSRWICCTPRFLRERLYAKHYRPRRELLGAHLPCRCTSLRRYSGAAWHSTTQVQSHLTVGDRAMRAAWRTLEGHCGGGVGSPSCAPSRRIVEGVSGDHFGQEPMAAQRQRVAIPVGVRGHFTSLAMVGSGRISGMVKDN